MINNRFLKILILLAIIFFHAQFLSHLFWKVGESSEDKEQLKFFRVSHFLFPLDYISSYELAYALLERGYQAKDNALILESSRWFKRSIENNPFYFLSHYNLGRAYLFYNYPQSEFFAEAVTAFKKAVLLNDRDKTIVLDTVKVFITLWPLLSEEDKRLTRDLLIKTAQKLNWGDFADIVEKWWLYAKDEDFMQKIIQVKPDFQDDTAELFARLGVPLKLRWSLLADYEDYTFQQVKNYTNSLAFRGETGLDRVVELLDRLAQIKFYGRLLGKEKFLEKEYIEVKNSLLQKKIIALFAEYGKSLTTGEKAKIRNEIREYIGGTDDFKQLDELNSMLEDNGFFDQNDFRDLYLKYLLEFKMGNFSKVIDEIEALQHSITFTKSEYQDEYVDILLLLVDSLESSKLLSLAEQALIKIIDQSPDKPAVFWRSMRVQRILGVDKNFLEQNREMVRHIEESRVIDLDSHQQNRVVYLMAEREIKIRIGDDLDRLSKGKTLLQVFIDGKIVFEEYVEKLEELVIIPVAEGREFLTRQVEIRFI
jgi:hypothetical protein